MEGIEFEGEDEDDGKFMLTIRDGHLIWTHTKVELPL